jgi:hypothetical protein
LNETIPTLRKADPIVDSLNVLSPNLADRGKEFDSVEPCATIITNSYIQRLPKLLLQELLILCSEDVPNGVAADW